MKKRNPMTKTKKTLLMFLYLVLLIASLLLLSVGLNERSYLNHQVISGQAVQVVEGEIKALKYYHAGRSGEQAKLHISGVKKWIYLNKVTPVEAEYFAVGNIIKIEVYPPPSSWFIRDYVRKHTLRSLGVQMGQQIIRSSEDRKHAVMRLNGWLLALGVFLVSILLVAAYALWKTPAINKGAN